MKRFKIKKIIIEDNEYINNFGISTIETDFELVAPKLRKKLAKTNYVVISLGYPKDGWKTNTDIFKFINKKIIDMLLRQELILIFDATLEGYGYNSYPIRKSLENAAIKRGINPKLIFLFTGNFLDESSIINVIPIYNLDSSFLGCLPKINNVIDSKKLFYKTIEDKHFLSLSRRNRFYRVLANFMMFLHPLQQFGIISQDKAFDFMLNDKIFTKISKTPADLENFKNSLPWIADKDNFNNNDPMNALCDLHMRTPFSLVNETLTDNENNTSFFYSEKILKPIIAFQPMIIYGQPGINKGLVKLGYKDYSDYFDLDFDDEIDNVIRFRKLQESMLDISNKLKNMTSKQRVEWRYKNLDLLQHNYDVFLQRTNAGTQMNSFFKKVWMLKKRKILF